MTQRRLRSLLFTMLLAMSQSGCLTLATSRVGPTGNIRIVPTQDSSQPLRALAFEVRLEDRAVKLRLSRRLSQRCQRHVEHRGFYNSHALLADLTLGGAMIGGGAQLREQCPGERCQTTALAASALGLLYAGAALLLRDQVESKGRWESGQPAACPTQVVQNASGSLDLIGLAQPRRLTAVTRTPEAESFEVTLPLQEALVAALRLPQGAVALTEVFPQLHELASNSDAVLAAEASLPRGFAIKANQDTPLEVTIRNTGQGATWARPRIETAHPHIVAKHLAPARLLEKGGIAVFSLPIHADERLTRGSAEFRLLIDRLDETPADPIDLLIPTEGRRPANLELLSATLKDGQSDADELTRGNGDHMLQRGEQVLLTVTVGNTGDEPTPKLTFHLFSPDRDVVVLQRRGEQAAMSIEPGSSETASLGFFVSMDFGRMNSVPSAALMLRITDESSKVLLTKDLEIPIGLPFKLAQEPTEVQLTPTH